MTNIEPSTHEEPEVRLTKWRPKPSDIIVANDGKLFLMFFDKALKMPNLEVYNKFYIKKSSYEKQLDTICKYINYFIKFYDTENELVSAYLAIKFAIDREKKFDASNPEQLCDLIYDLIFTDSMIKKIYDIVEFNYLDDIESDEDRKRSAKEKKHLESLEFTNHHIKILLRISFGMKIISPIIFHYISANVIKLEKDSDLLYNFYRKLFDIFSDNVNIYNKLFIYVKAKVSESKSHNPIMYEQRDILGSDEYIVMNMFVRKVLISENIVKYKFNEHRNEKTGKFKENIIGFNKTIIKYQLVYFLKDQYAKNLTEVTSAKNTDGLSGIDKMSMNMQKIDEGLIFIAEIGIRREMDRILKNNDLDITDAEVDYYVKHHNPSDLQVQFVRSYWGKYFGSYRNMSLITRIDYIKLLLILMKRLLMQMGLEENDGFSEFSRLPYILTGNIKDKVNTRVIRNNKFVSKINDSYLYEKLKDKKYKNLCIIKPDYLIGLLSQVINTTFTYVVYEKPELLGQDIVYNEDRISDELLFFLSMI